MTINGKLTE